MSWFETIILAVVVLAAGLYLLLGVAIIVTALVDSPAREVAGSSRSGRSRMAKTGHDGGGRRAARALGVRL